MVFFFTLPNSDWQCFLGEDKHENELLIANCTSRDLWFHVDKHSSAHCYLRVPQSFVQSHHSQDKSNNWWQSIPTNLLQSMACLCKANSITGVKLQTCGIIFTPASNLAKRGDMAIGEVGFHREGPKWIGRLHVASKASADLLKTIQATKRQVPFEQWKQQTDQEEREIRRALKSAGAGGESTNNSNNRKGNANLESPKQENQNDDLWAPLNDSKAMQSNRQCSLNEDDFFSL